VNVRQVRDADEFEIVFAAIYKERPNGLLVSAGPLTFANGKRIAAFAIKNRLASMYGRRQDVEAGGFMSYGADIMDRRVAIYVDRIVKGAKPADLPIRAAQEVRVSHQFEDRQADRRNDSAKRAGESGQSDQGASAISRRRVANERVVQGKT
jgi:hypothetical protein